MGWWGSEAERQEGGASLGAEVGAAFTWGPESGQGGRSKEQVGDAATVHGGSADPAERDRHGDSDSRRHRWGQWG